jgi:hypothetical protein
VNPDNEPIVITAADFPALLAQWENLPEYHAIFRSKAELGQMMASALRVLAYMGDAADKGKMNAQ